MSRFVLWLGLFGIASAAPLAATAAPVIVPPGLPAGSSYRLVFATDTGITAFSDNVADYNAFVTAAANTEPALVALGTNWKAIVSTSSIDARDNTGTNPSSSMGVPIYNLDGELVASSNADLWDQMIANPIMYDQHGAPPPQGNQLVWTGTEPSGIADEPVGTNFPSWGQGDLTGRDWVFSSYGTYGAEREFLLYGMSGVLTVVPEPSTVALAALGAIAALAMQLRRRR